MTYLPPGRAKAAFITFFSATAFMTTSSFAHEVDKNVKNPTVHDLSGFSKISVVGVYKLDVQVGEDFFVQTSGADKEVAKMDVYLDGDTLVLSNKDPEKTRNWRGNRNGISADITLPDLTGIEVAGIATGHVDGIKTTRFEIEAAGISDLKLSGTCSELSLDMAGMGSIEAKKLKCDDVEVALAGMGSVTVYASERVDASAAGMGSVEVFGKPKAVEKSGGFMAKVDIK